MKNLLGQEAGNFEAPEIRFCFQSARAGSTEPTHVARSPCLTRSLPAHEAIPRFRQSEIYFVLILPLVLRLAGSEVPPKFSL